MKINRLMLLLTSLLTACVGQPTVAPTPTSMPTVSPTDTPSPTPPLSIATPTPDPTSTPTAPSTPLLPTPTTTPLPPTPTLALAPAVERILFAPGATEATVEGYLPADESQVYVMHVLAGQFIEMNAAVGTMGQGLRFSIVGSDGAIVKPMGETHVRTVVPSTQDYYVELVSDVGAVSYRLSVLIPVRVRFAPGATSAEVTGSLAANGMRHYVLHALAGQRMIVEPRATLGQVGLVISGADGQVLLGGHVGRPGGVYDGILPTTQDYLIAVRARGETGADYSLEITIDATPEQEPQRIHFEAGATSATVTGMLPYAPGTVSKFNRDAVMHRLNQVLYSVRWL